MFYNMCFDVETGGFNADVNPITEFACVVYNPITLEDKFEFECLIKPYHNLVIDAGATKVTGLTHEKLMDEGIEFEEFIEIFKEICNEFKVHNSKKWIERPVLVGHNISDFDKYFLIHALKLSKDDLFKYVDEYMIDTLRDAKLKWHDKKGHKLGDCAKYIGYDLVEAHRAMPDVKANVELHKYLLTCMRNQNSDNSANPVKKFRSTFQLA